MQRTDAHMCALVGGDSRALEAKMGGFGKLVFFEYFLLMNDDG
jgi:hypothetical protein